MAAMLWRGSKLCLSAMAVIVASALSCAGPRASASAPAARCQPEVAAGAEAPGVTETHRLVDTWVARLGADEADRVLLGPAEIAALNARNGASDHGFRDLLRAPGPDAGAVDAQLRERFDWLRERFDAGEYVEPHAGAFAASRSVSDASTPLDELRVIVAAADLRCVPTDAPFYKPPIDPAFDRNRCSSLQPTELVRVLRQGPDGWVYVHSGHAVGWLRAPRTTPPLTPEAARAFRDPTTALVVTDDGWQVPGGPALRMGGHLPLLGRTEDGGYRVTLPTEAGLREGTLPADAPVHAGWLPLTRRNVWKLALARLGDGYGWGDANGLRDCSRLVLDLFATFGLRLQRHSSAQARSGSLVVDVRGQPEAAKLAAIREGARRGVVLLYMPGHIMLYLGEDQGRPFAVSAISDYVRPCEGGGHTVVRLSRVAVTDLELGRGTERAAFLERISHIAVFAP